MLINRIKLAKMLLKLAAISTDKAELIYEGDLMEGTEVFVERDGEIVIAEDGEYTTDDNTIVVSEGRVTEIRVTEDETIETEEVVIEEPQEEDNRVKELEDKVAELEKLLGEKDDKIAELESELTKRNDELNALQMSSELPAKEAAKQTKEGALRFF